MVKESMEQRASSAFQFKECVVQVELTGRRVNTLREFATALKEVPPGSIFHHMHHFFFRHHLELPDYSNDFSNWLSTGIEDRALAEKFANVAPFQFSSVEELREHILSILDGYLALHPELGDRRTETFYFDTATTLVFSGLQVYTLAEFRSELARTEVSAIYYHFYEARLRRRLKTDDFTHWLEQCFIAEPLVKAIRGVDPYMHSLEQLRAIVLRLFDRYASNVLLKERGAV